MINTNVKQKIIETDVVISGGGPVGLILAIGLANQGYKIVLAELCPLVKVIQKEAEKNTFDGRVLALSHSSMQLLNKLSIWSDLIPYMTEIQHVHVSQKGYLGLTKLHAEEVGVPALGYSIQSNDLGCILWQHVNQNINIQAFSPARLQNFIMTDELVRAEIMVEALADKKPAIIYQVTAKLIVGADGTNSKVRKILQLPIEEKSYHAFGVIAKIETQEPPLGWSYERFTEQGPVALLPMQGHTHKAVMVCPESQIEMVKSLDDEDFVKLFSEKMGERLGAFTNVRPRVVYPIKESYAPQMSKGRALLMGNASHTQHPVAAQGLNLGITDIEVFLSFTDEMELIGEPDTLERYAKLRKSDHKKVMGMTDSLIQVFQHRSPIVGSLRGLGLIALEVMPKVKRRFSRFAIGGRK